MFGKIPVNVSNYEIAVLIPCYNEAVTIQAEIHAFKQILPESLIYVYDNNSTDNTAQLAKEAGAIVKKESKKGKGNVVRKMFSDIDADIYVLIDGDGTYAVSAAPLLINKLMDEKLDMVVGKRVVTEKHKNAYRFGHRFGNKLFNQFIGVCFGSEFSDVFSGYRIFSRRFVKTFPAFAKQFDLEMELTVHSLELQMPTAEVETNYIERPRGSYSKLHSYRDGMKIGWQTILLLKDVRPLFFFGVIFLALALVSLLIFLPVLINYIHTGLVPRLPTALLSTGMMLLAFISLTCGLILDTVRRGQRAMQRCFYLFYSANKRS